MQVLGTREDCGTSQISTTASEVGGGKEVQKSPPVPYTASELLSLWDAWLRGSKSAGEDASSLVVVFNKTCPPGSAVPSQDVAQLRLSLVSTPLREDFFLPHPGVNSAAPFSGVILA